MAWWPTPADRAGVARVYQSDPEPDRLDPDLLQIPDSNWPWGSAANILTGTEAAGRGEHTSGHILFMRSYEGAEADG